MYLFTDFGVAPVGSRSPYLVARNLVGSEDVGCLQHKSFASKVSQTESDKME